MKMLRNFRSSASLALPLAGLLILASCGKSGDSTSRTQSTNQSPGSPASGAPLSLTPSTNAAPVESEADRAWAKLFSDARASQPRMTNSEPTPAEIEKFKKQGSDWAVNVSDEAKKFQKLFPDHEMALEAKKLQMSMLEFAADRFGDTNQLAALEAAEDELAKDPKLTEDERFELKIKRIQRQGMAKEAEGKGAVFAEFERGVRALQKEYPNRPETYQLLLEIAANIEGDKAKALARDLATETNAPPEIRMIAEGFIRRFNLLGQPADLKVPTLDGKTLELSSLRGKVVLLDFWATWCGPCIRELPNLRALYEKHHPNGFEIVGISFDEEKETLQKFIADQNMDWPQSFDAASEKPYAQEFGLHKIPAMWLIDKKGVLRDLDPRENLAEKVEKLLAEP